VGVTGETFPDLLYKLLVLLRRTDKVKAIDYVQMFPDLLKQFEAEYPDQDERIIRCGMEICAKMLDEMDDIRKKRQVITNGGYSAIFEEMRTKWKAVSSRLKQTYLPDEFFDWFMAEHLPKTWGLSQKIKSLRIQHATERPRY
jgi:hypothetical protein